MKLKRLPFSYIFRCKLCKYQTSHRRCLISHKKKMHPVIVKKKYTCTLCQASFERIVLFQSHIKYKLCRHKVEVMLTNGDDQSQSQSGSGAPGDLIADGDGATATHLNAQPEVNLNSSNRTATDGSRDFESEESLSLPIFGFDGRMPSEMKPTKIRSPDNPPNQIFHADGEGNDSEFELNMQARPASRMTQKFANSEEPQCSVIQSEPILVWNTSVVPSIQVERLRTDEDARIIAKWLLKMDSKQDKIVTNEESTVSVTNLQSTINKYKRFKCDQCDKLYCWKRTLNAHVKHFHENPSLKCNLSRLVTQLQTSNRKIKCISCNVSFNNQREVQLHKPRCLKAQQVENNSLRSEISMPVKNDELELLNCVEMESEAVPSTLEFPVVYKKRRRKPKRLFFSSVTHKAVVKRPKTNIPKSFENEMSTITVVATETERLEDESGTRCPECGAKCVSAEAVAAHLKRHKIKIGNVERDIKGQQN